MTDEPPRRDVAYREPGLPANAGLVARLRGLVSLLDAAPVGVGLWTADGELVHANASLVLLLGEPASSLPGRTLATIVESRDEADLGRDVDRIRRGEIAAFRCRMRFLHPVDGTRMVLPARVFGVFTETHQADYLISVIDFIDAPTEPATAHLADRAPVMLWFADHQAMPIGANAATLDFLGLADEVDVGMRWWERVHPEDYEAVRATIAASLHAGQPLDVTGRMLRSDREWRWLHHRAEPVLDDDGRLLGYAGVSIDVTDHIELRDELAHVRRLFESITEAGPVAVARIDRRGGIVYANRRWTERLGDEAPLEGGRWQQLLPPDQLDDLLELAAESRRSGRAFSYRVQTDPATGIVGPPGEGRPGERSWADIRVAPVTDDEGRDDGWVVTLSDVTATIEASTRADRLARVLDAGSDFLMITERNGALTYVNNAAHEVLGVDAGSGDETGSFLMDVLDGESNDYFHDVVEPVLAEEGTWRGELTFRRRGGSDIPVSAVFVAHTGADGRIESLSAVARDISDLKQAQGQMLHLATHDYLTGLPNRLLLYDRLEQALARHRRYGQPAALLFVDLDRFKPVNDEFGHHVGDAVLVAVADRMQDVVRETDTAARLGGDEFAVLVEGIADQELLERIGERLIAAISEPVAVEGVQATIGASIGLVPVDRRITDADALIAAADATMYQAKAQGRGRVVVRPPDEP